jgi:flagellar protein FliO/FliZ
MIRARSIVPGLLGGCAVAAATAVRAATSPAAASAASAARAAASSPLGAARPFAAPVLAGSPAPTVFEGLGQVTLALGAVLVAIFALAWLLRRVRAVAGRADALSVLAEVRVGPKERAVLIKVGGSQLLVGVAPGQVSTLHVLDQPVNVAGGRAATPERPSFRALLMRSLGK